MKLIDIFRHPAEDLKQQNVATLVSDLAAIGLKMMLKSPENGEMELLASFELDFIVGD